MSESAAQDWGKDLMAVSAIVLAPLLGLNCHQVDILLSSFTYSLPYSPGYLLPHAPAGLSSGAEGQHQNVLATLLVSLPSWLSAASAIFWQYDDS